MPTSDQAVMRFLIYQTRKLRSKFKPTSLDRMRVSWVICLFGFILASGINSSKPHAHPHKPVEAGVAVTMDPRLYDAVSDMTDHHLGHVDEQAVRFAVLESQPSLD